MKVSSNNHKKYIRFWKHTAGFNDLAAGILIARLAKANLVTGTKFDIKLKSLNQKINSNKTKHVLHENELQKLKTFD